MAKVYARLVRTKKMHLEDVPPRWREEAARLLAEAE